MKNVRVRLLTGLQVAMLAGISTVCMAGPTVDLKVASAANFEAQLAKIYGKGVCFEKAEFPTKGSILNFTGLVKAGLVHMDKIPTGGANFTLTKLGEKFYTPSAEARKQGGNFCVGQLTPKVLRFSVPGEMGGLMLSSVRYTLQSQSVPGWAYDAQLLLEYKPLRIAKKFYDGKYELSLDAVLNNTGWEVRYRGY